MSYMDVVSKYNVGQLNKCIIDENINNGMNILIPLNMRLLRATEERDFLNTFNLNLPLYYVVEFGNDDFIRKPKIRIAEYNKHKIEKNIDFPYDDEKRMWIHAIALEGLMYVLNEDCSYVSFHNMG